MARGRSGRLNSGVIFASNASGSRSFLRRVLASATEDVPLQHRKNLKYENGNIIYVAETYGGVGDMGIEWNNSIDPTLEDHIRHYTGDMRLQYRRPPLDALRFALARRTSPRPTAAPQRRPDAFVADLAALTEEIAGQSSGSQ